MKLYRRKDSFREEHARSSDHVPVLSIGFRGLEAVEFWAALFQKTLQ
jgi:hypothetical protein